MQIISGCTDFKLTGKSAVAVGKFDGIHIGHKVLLLHLMEQKQKGYRAVVFTFDPPANQFFGKGDEKELTPLLEKRKLFEMLGVDVLVEFPLNKETASIPAEDFIRKVLKEQMNVAYIAAGTDLSFGAGGKGNGELLAAMAEELQYEVEIIHKILYEDREISSSYVREVVEKGDMETAIRLLGEPYRINGVVESGKRLGRTLGMPTLNLYPDKNKLLPPAGVYYSQVLWKGKCYPSITNIGCKPTVSEVPVVGAETYLYDFRGDLYGEEITVTLLKYKRPERKFENVEALKMQMQCDLSEGRVFHDLEDVTKG